MQPSIKLINGVAAVSKTAGATGTCMIDTMGYDFLAFAIREATVDVVSNKPTVLKFTESDATVLTDASSIVALTGGTATSTSVGFVIATGNTSVTTITQFNIDLRGRKRYLFFSYSPAVTQINEAWGALARGEVSPQVLATSTKQFIEG